MIGRFTSEGLTKGLKTMDRPKTSVVLSNRNIFTTFYSLRDVSSILMSKLSIESHTTSKLVKLIKLREERDLLMSWILGR